MPHNRSKKVGLEKTVATGSFYITRGFVGYYVKGRAGKNKFEVETKSEAFRKSRDRPPAVKAKRAALIQMPFLLPDIG